MDVIKAPNDNLNSSLIIKPIATVLVTDIGNLSDFMDQEADAVIFRNQQLHYGYAETYGATRIQALGSLMLLSFPGGREAVAGAMGITTAAREELQLELCSGMHLGEVTYTEEDVYGQTVNIASLIQAASKPAQVLMSEAVMQNVHTNMYFAGSYQLNGMQHPVRLFEARTDVLNLQATDPAIGRKESRLRVS